MWWATFKLAVRNLLLHKLRSFLTVLGTILGVSSVIAMLSVGEGSKKAAVDQIRQLGANNVMVRSVRPGEGKKTQGNNNSNSSNQQSRRTRVLSYGLKEEDLRTLKGLLGEIDSGELVSEVVPISLHRKNVQYKSQQISNARVLGTTPELLKVRNFNVARGRFIREEDLTKIANIAVLSEGAATRLFRFEDALGQTLHIGKNEFRIVGILRQQSSGNATAGGVGNDNLNEDIYIPISSSRSRLGELQRIVSSGSRSYERNQLSEIAIAATSEETVPQIADMVRSLLAQKHKDDNEYEIVVPLELLEQAEHEKQIWNIVLGSIAGISLLVGGIGIMNIMLATVTERTREIGIRRAIGAKRIDIVRQFLFETIVLSTTGGIIGITLGVSIPFFVTQFAGIPTITSIWSVILAFGISLLTGVIFGVYPARKAAQMNPIEALRHQ